MAGLICVLFVTVIGVVVGSFEENMEGGKCERIRLPLCQELEYNWTAMPNLMGHTDQKEAEEAMSAFAVVLESRCSVHARFLLCSAFAPLCSEQVAVSVSACRGLCETVLKDCASQLQGFMKELDCSAFPAERKLCMRPPNASEPPLPSWTWREQGGCPPAHARAPAGDCWPACGGDARHSAADKTAAHIRMTALAWLSLLSTTFALLTFCAEPSRYRYPERPIVWVAACHAIVALAYVARGWLGAKIVSCSGATLAVDGLSSPSCVAFFAITYYFTLAADAWFTNACVAWYLTAASEWSTEALERAAAYLHAVAWGWAGAWTAAALALRRVTADELTGTCGVADAAVAALVGVPRGALLVTSLALAIGACPGIMRVRRALDTRGARRVGRLALRAAAAGALYLILAAGGTAIRILEARLRSQDSPVVELEEGQTGAWSVCVSLSCGVAAGVWSWSRKSGAVWRKALCPPRKAPCCAPPLLGTQQPYYKRPLHVSRV